VQQLLADFNRVPTEEHDDSAWLTMYDWNLMVEKVAKVYTAPRHQIWTAPSDPWRQECIPVNSATAQQEE
jgi:hypothetical protein